ncbi:MAG: helix-turn-helix transcriptional regulator [Lachnospiraceae bacterium]|nr:helix-turn-helix transcriptional regulator [Lachnospiraceae bacterium]
MKDLNIGRNLIQYRRKRGITQEELAEHMGVSKASVSKWETATTYPDITLLPRLASYFHITVDELMGYEPQMTREEIRTLYRQLARDFAAKPFDEVQNRCREIVRDYFSCPPLLFQIGSLYVNYCSMAETPDKQNAVLKEALALFCRVQEAGDDAALKNQALHMEALCLLQLGEGAKVPKLLHTTARLNMAPESLLAMAFQQLGNQKEAVRTLQAGIYQAVVELMNLLPGYLALCQEDPAAQEETCRRALAVADIFQLETLHPSVLFPLYLAIAQHRAGCGQADQALEILERYCTLALSDIYPLRLHGDSYFTFLDEWIEDNLPRGSDLPRDEAAVRQSIADAVSDNPAFENLRQDKRFQAILHRLTP